MKFLLSKLFRKKSSSEAVRTVKKKLFSADRWLIVAVFALSLFGVLMVYDSSVAIGIRDFSDQYYFVREQLKWFVVGIVVFIVCARMQYRVWYTLALPLLFITLLLLMAVFIPGIGINALGAHRWINVGLFILQPAELAKLAMIIYLAAWFTHPEKSRFFSFLLFLAMVVGLVMLEPDLGTSMIILSIAILLYFFSGAPFRHFSLLIPLIALVIGGLALIVPYRISRLTTFFNPHNDTLGASYQIRQVLLGLGSGGLTGVGIGKSRQKYEYLPEANTDSIFAIIGEETGLVGSSVISLIYLFLVWRGFRIAKRALDAFVR